MKEQTKEIIKCIIGAVVIFMCLAGPGIIMNKCKSNMDAGLKERFEPMPIHTCMINDSTYHVSFGDEACILIENGSDETRIMYHSQYETLYYVQDSIVVTVVNKDRNVSYAVDADTLVRHKDNVVFKN